jgi:hypothetical protein
LCKNNLSNADIAPLTVEIGRSTSLRDAGGGFTPFFKAFTEQDGLFADLICRTTKSPVLL